MLHLDIGNLPGPYGHDTNNLRAEDISFMMALTNLQSLNLAGTDLSGANVERMLASVLSNLTQLSSLDLSGNVCFGVTVTPDTDDTVMAAAIGQVGSLSKRVRSRRSDKPRCADCS